MAVGPSSALNVSAIARPPGTSCSLSVRCVIRKKGIGFKDEWRVSLGRSLTLEFSRERSESAATTR